MDKSNKALHFRDLLFERGKETCSEVSRLIQQISQDDDRDLRKTMTFDLACWVTNDLMYTVSIETSTYSLQYHLRTSQSEAPLFVDSLISPLASIREQRHCVGLGPDHSACDRHIIL
jgi:hypothetical protein